MKNLILIIAIGIMFFSCKKEEINPTINNDMAKQKITPQSDNSIINGYFGNYVGIGGTDVYGNIRDFTSTYLKNGQLSYYIIGSDFITRSFEDRSKDSIIFKPVTIQISFQLNETKDSIYVFDQYTTLIYTLARDIETNNVVVKYPAIPSPMNPPKIPYGILVFKSIQ